MPRPTFKQWEAQCPEKMMSTLREDTRLSDGHESNFSEATESEFKVGFAWMLPTCQQYTVTKKQGKCGELPRVGTVTCKWADHVLVHWSDNWVERRLTSHLVPIDVPLQPSQFQ